MIEVEHLSKVYGSTAAIRDVTFSVEPGEILGFLGPNGAGKTTTMRILSGYLPATSGTARIAGFDVHDESMAVRRRIGYLPETPPLYPEMTVAGFLTFVARIKGVSAGDRPARVQSALSRCNLTEKQNVLIRKLSKGFRQRVGIAQAIVHDPPAIILDEPTVGLDPRQIIDVRNLIKSLAGDHTVILSTHILPEVSMVCSRVAIINKGQVVATNTPDQLVSQLTGGLRYELEVVGAFDGVRPALQALQGITAVEAIALRSADGEEAGALGESGGEGDLASSPENCSENSPENSPANSSENSPEIHPDERYRIRVELEPGTDSGREIAAIIVGAGLGLYEMRRSRVSLEDVFLELTTEEKIADSEATSDEATSDEATSDEATGDESTGDESTGNEANNAATPTESADPQQGDAA